MEMIKMGLDITNGEIESAPQCTPDIWDGTYCWGWMGCLVGYHPCN